MQDVDWHMGMCGTGLPLVCVEFRLSMWLNLGFQYVLEGPLASSIICTD